MNNTQNSPKISVIMGVYNCKDFLLLKKSVDSIIAQTFADWEFIICDDGSTDTTLRKLNEISQSDKRIKIISYKQNRGLAYALNQCIKASHGEYIARQDDDDISEATRLQEQADVLNAHPEYAVVGTNARVFDDSGFWGTYTNVEFPDKKAFQWNSPFAHPTVMMRKDALLKRAATVWQKKPAAAKNKTSLCRCMRWDTKAAISRRCSINIGLLMIIRNTVR